MTLQIPNPPVNTYGMSPYAYKILMDRYAEKCPNREALREGSMVLVQAEAPTESNVQGRKEIGYITQITGPLVHVRTWDGEEIIRPVEQIDLPLEEAPSQIWERVARGAAQAEDPSRQEESFTEFSWLLEDWKFLPAGRILAGCGTGQQLTFQNCFVVGSPPDSMDGIFTALRNMSELMRRGGGVGLNLSTLRPRYAYVKGVNGRSSGAANWSGLYSFVTGRIEQGGSRRGALMLILNVWHPDLLEFINSKRRAGQLENANISIGITDAFMAAVKADAPWNLEYPDTKSQDYHTEGLWTGDLAAWKAAGRPTVVWKTLPAREVWRELISAAHASGEPGVWFVDQAQRMSNSWYYPRGQLICTNPCGEQSLPAWGVCNLGHLNLPRFLEGRWISNKQRPDQAVNWDALRRAIRASVRFLDNIIDVTHYYVPEIENQQKGERRVGLGTMGLAEMLIRLELRYGDQEAQDFSSHLYKFVATEAYRASTDLAEEKGSFPWFDSGRYLESGFMREMPGWIREQVKDRGIRNVCLLTQAPTGTVGTMAETSTGIEPFFDWNFIRKGRLGSTVEQVSVLLEWEKVKPAGVNGVLPNFFVNAMQLRPEEHVAMQAVIQRWTDASISKTCNCPPDYTVEQTQQLYELMYELGCKGGTIYRDRSRDEQVLNRIEPSKNGSTKEKVRRPFVRPRPARREGSTISKMTAAGTANITLNHDADLQPLETFLGIGKGGSDLNAMAEAIGRLGSLLLRIDSPVPPVERVRLIVDQLRDIGGARDEGFGPARIRSVPDAFAKALAERYLGEPTESEMDVSPVSLRPDLCPGCGMLSAVYTEGCMKCSCGWSAC